MGETVATIFPTRVESQDHRRHLALGAVHPFFDPHDEDLVDGLDDQAIQLFTFRLSFHLAVLLSDRGDPTPTFYRYLPYGRTIVGPPGCRSGHNLMGKERDNECR